MKQSIEPTIEGLLELALLYERARAKNRKRYKRTAKRIVAKLYAVSY